MSRRTRRRKIAPPLPSPIVRDRLTRLRALLARDAVGLARGRPLLSAEARARVAKAVAEGAAP